jgi:integrase
VDKGVDPQADKVAQRSAGTFKDLHRQYLEQYAQKRNKSWRQGATLVTRYVTPMIGDMSASVIKRADIERVLGKIDAPILANAVLSSVGAVFSWAMKKQIAGVTVHPCRGIERNENQHRQRVLSDSELPKFWSAFDQLGQVGKALKLTLLLGQRPGEVCAMRYEHIVDGWWQQPGENIPALHWPGTKNGENHRVYLPKAALEVMGELRRDGFLFRAPRAANGPQALNENRLSNAMRSLCQKLGIADKVTPHDLRRTHGTRITGLGFGRDAMNRIQNHREGGIADVYDQHKYAAENMKIMDAVSDRIMALAEGKSSDNVLAFSR